MLNAFKIKPFDLQPIYEEWKDAPVFNGNPKKDMPVEEWLDKIKEGCIKRGVPEEYWYKVAQHYMGTKAKARLDELKEVIRKVHGGKYRWTWKKFRIAILNMGWNIDKSETRTINWKPSWFGRKKDDSEAAGNEVAEPEPAKKDTMFPNLWPSSRRGSVSSVSEAQPTDPASTSHHRTHSRPAVRRAATELAGPNDTKPHSQARRPSSAARRPSSVRSQTSPPPRSHHESTSTSHPSSRKPSPPPRAHTLQVTEIRTPGVVQNDSKENNEVQAGAQAQAPVWLLNACNALDFITSEHPKAMSVISAILITVGSIPAIPAISAGAGGAVLASGAAHAIGAIAVGVGQAISMTVKNNQQSNQSNQSNQNQITNGTHS